MRLQFVRIVRRALQKGVDRHILRLYAPYAYARQSAYFIKRIDKLDKPPFGSREFCYVYAGEGYFSGSAGGKVFCVL